MVTSCNVCQSGAALAKHVQIAWSSIYIYVGSANIKINILCMEHFTLPGALRKPRSVVFAAVGKSMLCISTTRSDRVVFIASSLLFHWQKFTHLSVNFNLTQVEIDCGVISCILHSCLILNSLWAGHSDLGKNLSRYLGVIPLRW